MRDIAIPGRESLISEVFSWVEFPRLMMSAPHLLNQPRGRGEQILVFPGFGAGNLSTLPLRRYLQAQGYRVRGWDQGTNQGDVPDLIESMKEFTSRQYYAVPEAERAPLSLIGWSLGGYIAREVARELPDLVSSVITMGSPVVGGPKYTTVAPVFTFRGFDLDEVERQVDERFDTPLNVPVTAIYSKRDGVVAWEACIDEYSPHVEHIEVTASHVGLGISADVFEIIAQRLAGSNSRH